MAYRVLLAIWITLAVIAAPARAQNADAQKRAQDAFDAAQAAYQQGKYDEAAAGFQAAYDARPASSFLYNAAASFHMKGKTANDVAAYENLKRSLSAQFAHDRAAYTDAKAPFFWEVIRRADQWAQQSGWEPGPSDA